MPSDKANDVLDNDERKAYEVQRAQDEMSKFLYHDDEWTDEKLSRFLRTCMPSAERVADVLNKVMLARGDRDAKGNYEHDLNSAEVKRAVRERSRGFITEWLCTLDPFTRVAAAGVYKHAEPVIHFKDFTPHFYIAPLLHGGKFGYIRGSPGRGLGVGKTMYACLVMEMALIEQMAVVTNIAFKETPAGVTRVITLSQMLRQCIKNMIAGKSTLVILDEAPQFMPKERGTSKETVNMKQIMYLMRKVGASLVVIAQREAEIPTAIIDLAVWRVQKKEKELMVYTRENDSFMIAGVPPSVLPYDTLESASFVVDLNVMLMHDAVVQAEVAAMDRGGKTQWQIILEFLDLDSSKITERDIKIAAKVLIVKALFMQKEAAKILGVSPATMSNWMKEMNIKPMTCEVSY